MGKYQMKKNTEMRKSVIIIGQHPILQSLLRQYQERECAAVAVADAESVSADELSKCEELALLPSGGDDNASLDLLRRLANKMAVTGKRPIVHLLLQSQTTLWMLQTMDLPAEVNEAFDVYPFTMEDVWAKNILVQLPGIKGGAFPRLDRVPIDAKSRQTVHLVVSGSDRQAEAVAIHAALVAHFPNYDGGDELPLRTRITIVDDNITARRNDFIAMHQHLFDNSFYRTVDIKGRKSELHRPMYYGQRKDFVDVEWEFVDGSISDETVRQKLVLWARSESQQLTVVVSHENDEKCLAQCVSLPAELYEWRIPVFVRQSRSGLAEQMKRSYTYNNVYPFGMLDCGYDVTLPLVRMAKLLNYFYDCSYNDKKGVPTVLPQAEVDEAWRKVKSFKFRFSNIYNVMTIATKMHSLGHDETDMDAFYALTAEEIHSLAQTEHNRWSVERLIIGSRPCTDEEKDIIRNNIREIIAAPEEKKKEIEDLKKRYKKQKDIHFDLCAYDELETDPTGKNAQVYDYDLTACIPLIAKTFYDENYGRE